MAGSAENVVPLEDKTAKRQRTRKAAPETPNLSVPEAAELRLDPVPEGFVGQAKVSVRPREEGYRPEEVLEAQRSRRVLQATVVEVYRGEENEPVAVVNLSPTIAGLVPAREWDERGDVRDVARYMESFIGRLVHVLVLSVDEENGLAACSRRAAREAMAKARLETLTRGMVVEGTVRAVAENGLVVDIGGLTGFLPMHELSDVRLRVGDLIDVMVVGIHPTKRRVSLSVRELATGYRSWEERVARIRRGAVMLGTVQAIRPGREGSQVVLVRLHPTGVIGTASMPKTFSPAPGMSVAFTVQRISPEKKRIYGAIRRRVE